MYILLYIFSLVLSLAVGGISSLLIVIFTILMCILHSRKMRMMDKYKLNKLYAIVTFIYVLSSIISSFSFINGNYFLVYDVMSYTRYIPMTKPNTDFINYLQECYFLFSDSNALHEIYVRGACIIANNYLDGANEVYLILIHTIFGILSIGILYRILLNYYNSHFAYKYSLLFALFSPFLFYSTVVLRDIVIAYFYIRCFELCLQNRFSYKAFLALLIFPIIVIGIRLYSGLFCLLFLFVYLYIHISKSRYSKILVPIIGVGFAIVGFLAIGSSLFEQSKEELAYYKELDLDRGTVSSGGLSYKLLGLPPGLKQVVLTFYSQMMPFPPLAAFKGLKIDTFSNGYLCFMYSLFPIWWYFIFYSLIYWLIYKHKANILTKYDWIFLGITILFIMLNTSHIDVRRMMPVYPILFYLYLKVNRCLTNSEVNDTKNLLIFVYISLIILYLLITN